MSCVNCVTRIAAITVWSALLMTPTSFQNSPDDMRIAGGKPEANYELQLICVADGLDEGPKASVLRLIDPSSGFRVKLGARRGPNGILLMTDIRGSWRWVPELQVWEITLEEAHEILDSLKSWYLAKLIESARFLLGLKSDNYYRPFFIYPGFSQRHTCILTKEAAVRLPIVCEVTKRRCCTLIFMAQESDE